MVIPVVVQIQNPVEFAIDGDMNFLGVLDTLTQSLSGILFHLYVIELPKVTEPFDKLGSVVLVELDIREIHFENR